MRPLLPVPPASRRRVARQLQGRRSRGLIHSLAHVAQSHLFGVRPSARAAIQLPGEAGRCRVGFSRASARTDSRRALACRDCTVGARRRTPRRRAAPRYAATARHLRRVKRQSSPLERRAAIRGGWLLPDPAGFGAASRSEVARSRRSSFLVKGPSWALNANAKLKLERAEFVGWDARTARARHADEANREHARRHTCAWASAAYERRSDGDPNRFYRSRD